VMVHDEKSVGFYISPGKHGLSIVTIHGSQATHATGSRGGQRSFPLPVSLNEMPYGISEYDYAGGFRKALPVIRGEVTGLPIPA